MLEAWDKNPAPESRAAELWKLNCLVYVGKKLGKTTQENLLRFVTNRGVDGVRSPQHARKSRTRP